MMSTRTNMPIMGSKTIPCIRWSVVEGHERQAMENHGQTLERLAERGGLGVCEAVAIIENHKWHKMDKQAAEDRLMALCEPEISATKAAETPREPSRIADLETALRAAQATIGGLEMEVARLTVEAQAASDGPSLKDWNESAKYLLDSYPKSVRSCYKHGPENLMESMCITFLGMRKALATQAATVTGASTLGQQVARAQAEMATWSPELRASVRLEGGDAVTGAQAGASEVPCPFCGSSYIHKGAGGLKCANCRARGPWYCSSVKWQDRDSKAAECGLGENERLRRENAAIKAMAPGGAA